MYLVKRLYIGFSYSIKQLKLLILAKMFVTLQSSAAQYESLAEQRRQWRFRIIGEFAGLGGYSMHWLISGNYSLRLEAKWQMNLVL